MNGPCLCGDPYCGRCFPGGAALEAAVEKALEAFDKAGLRAEEYDFAVKVGIEAVKQAREYAKMLIDEQKMMEQENKAFEEGV